MMASPILVSVMQKQFDHIARQMGWVMTRTARSPVFSESHDFSCFLCDRTGQLMTQADGLPIHTGGGGLAVKSVLGTFDGRIRDGDVFLLNDPYLSGGNHLPDWTLIRPIFVEGRLCGFACNRAHQSDIGGGAAGTYNAGATEIFHEGIRLPVLKLFERGARRDDIWSLLLANTRCPELLDGDLRAMIGSTAIGAKLLGDAIEKLGVDVAFEVFEEILDHAERTMRRHIRDLPNGAYHGEDSTDTDCFDSVRSTVRVRLTVKDEELLFDFTGTDPQTRGFKNSSLANTLSSVYVAIGATVASDVPRNDGLYRPVTVIAPEGSVVNARAPAAMTMNTMYPAGEIVNACWKALAQAAPERACAGWGKIAHPTTSGRNRDGSTYVMYHWHALLGAGAVKGRDGFNTVSQLTTLGGQSLPNVERYEQLYPVKIRTYEFRKDAAGAGTFRGGTGVEYLVEVNQEATYAFRGEGLRTPSGFGIAGGELGKVADMEIVLADGSAYPAPQYAVETLGPLTMRIRSAAGGGWGDPSQRAPERIRRDIEDGLLSPEKARADYGFEAVD